MRIGGFLSLVLALWGGALVLQVPRQPPEVIPVHGGAVLRVFPPAESGPVVALACFHSVFQDPDTAEAPARAAARAGMLGVQVLLPSGATFEEHLASGRRILERLRRDPRVSEVWLYGHSMGADLACSLALEDGAVPRVVAAGFPVEGRPRGLLLAVGAWDELHPLAELRALGAPLVVLDSADHGSETVSPDLFDAVAGRAAALRPDPFLGRGLLALGLVLPLRAAFRRTGRGLAAFVIMAAWLAPVPGLLAAVGLAALLAASLAGVELDPALAARRAGLVLAAAGTALAVNSWGSLADDPARILGLGVLLAQALPLVAARLGSSLSPLGIPGWGLAVWLGLELLAPGRPALWVGDVHRRVVEAVRRLDARPRLQASPLSALALAICLGAATLAWREVARAGYALDLGEALRLVGLFARLALLPAALLVAAVRRGLWA